jgi:hypothetical protein
MTTLEESLTRAVQEGLTMVCAPSEAQKRMQELQAFVQTNMQRDVDYGVIPGTDKPSLYQPGAQKLAEIYGFGHRFQVVEQVKDWGAGFFYFEYKCQIFLRRTDQPVAEGIGSCNSKESKYADRWMFESELPEAIDKATLKTRTGVSRKNGRPFTMFRVPNPDPFSIVNTLQKMAAKRAYIHAVISATRSSGILTQDVEDLPPEAFGAARESRSWVDDAEPQPAKAPPKESLEERIRAESKPAPAPVTSAPQGKAAGPSCFSCKKPIVGKVTIEDWGGERLYRHPECMIAAKPSTMNDPDAP